MAFTYNPILGLSGSLNQQGYSQADIDKQIQDALNKQNTAITNDIVKQSQNVQFRDPASYFYGFTGNPYRQQGTQQTGLLNVAMPSAMPANNQYQQALQALMQRYNLLG